MGSFESATGYFYLPWSIKFLSDYLKTQIESNVVVFNEGTTSLIESFEDKIENDFFADNSVLVLENCFFTPEEVGFRNSSGGEEENDGYEKLGLSDK